MQRISLFIILTVIFGLKASAQTEVLFQVSEESSFLFTNSNTLNSNTNHIIHELAEGNNKSIQRTEFNLNFKENLRITKTGNECLFIVDLSKFSPSGDVKYNGFSLNNEIVPTSMAFKMDVTDKNNNLIKRYDFKDLDIKNNEAKLIEERFIDTLKRDLKLSIYDLNFSYSKWAITNFDNKIYTINDYYTCDVPLTNAVQLLQLVNPTDIDNLPLHQANLLNCENIIADINSKKIQQKLPLAEFDPIQFDLKMNALLKQSVAKRNAINFTMATLHQTYYNRGLENLANNQTLMAQKWFTKSLEVNPTYAPAMLQLAKIDFANGNLNDAEARVKDIFIKMNPDPQTQQFSGELAAQISTQYTALGEEYNQKGNYQLALNTLQRASSVCSTIPGLVCNEKLQLNISKAKNGIYNTIIKEATLAYKEGKLKQAENKVNEAYFYQKENNADVTSTEDADVLMAKIKQIEYNQVFNDAKNNLKNKKYSDALKLFNEAEELKNNYKLKHDVNFEKLRAEAAKPVLLSKVDSATELVNANKLDEAKTAGKKIEEQQRFYVLLNDKELNAKLDQLQGIIFKQECANAQIEIDKLHNEAKQAVKDKAFIKADNLFVKAIDLMKDFEMCTFTNTTLKEEQITNLPGAIYQKLLITVIELQDSYRYKEAVEKYTEAEKYFFQLEVNKLKLSNLSLYDFAIKNGNVKWQQYLAQHFLDKKELDKSLAMCKFLIGKNISPKNIKYTLYDLGKALATRDLKQNPAIKPKVEVIKYTDGNSKLKLLKKGYLKMF